MDRRAALGVVERGRHAKRSELAGFGRADEGKFSHTLPLAKAMDDVIVAHAQNGEPIRPCGDATTRGPS